MSYGYSRGPLVMGDISGSDDANRNTGIDFEEDYIALKTNGNTRFRISGSSGEIRFNEAFTFPTSDGSANQVLKTDGSGQLSWTNQSGGGGGGGGGSTNSFQTISVSGQSDVVADSSTDTLTLVKGNNINITTNAGSDELTISAYDVGKILQTVHVPFTGLMSSNSQSFVNITDGSTTLQASITPSANSSKILIQVALNAQVQKDSSMVFHLWNGSSTVGGGVAPGGASGRQAGILFQHWNYDFNPQMYSPLSFSTVVEDSPNTTSQVTYTVRGASGTGAGTFYINQNIYSPLDRLEHSYVVSSITLYEIGA
jgi:hypothetical protein